MSVVTASGTFELRRRAEHLASALPPMLVAAERIANAVIHGLHGRRRSGPGEDFWQYRSYSFGDSVQSIDWRKSSRSDRVLVRENEWAASHTVWLWASQGPGMAFHSHLADTTKRDRAVLCAVALAYPIIRLLRTNRIWQALVLGTRDYVRRVLALYHGTEPTLSFPPSTGQSSIVSGRRKPRIIRNSQNRIVVTTALDTRR